MSEQISGTDNSDTAVLDNPQGTENVVEETSPNGGQATEAAPTELFQGMDPNKLPPQAKVFYDQMLRDYREKTTRLSETIKSEAAKAAEAYKSKAETYDQIAAQEEFVKQWNDYVKKSQGQGENPQNAGDPVLTEMKAKLDEMNQKIQLNEMGQITESFADAVNEKGEKIHPDFDALNDIVVGEIANGPQKEPFSLLRAAVELAQGSNPQEKLANGYKMAKAARDAIFEEGRKAGMGRVQQKVINGTQPAAHSVGDTLSITDKKPKNAREALDMARKGIIVSRD